MGQHLQMMFLVVCGSISKTKLHDTFMSSLCTVPRRLDTAPHAKDFVFQVCLESMMFQIHGMMMTQQYYLQVWFRVGHCVLYHGHNKHQRRCINIYMICLTSLCFISWAHVAIMVFAANMVPCRSETCGLAHACQLDSKGIVLVWLGLIHHLSWAVSAGCKREGGHQVLIIVDWLLKVVTHAHSLWEGFHGEFTQVYSFQKDKHRQEVPNTV